MAFSAAKQVKLTDDTASSAHFSRNEQNGCKAYRNKQVVLRFHYNTTVYSWIWVGLNQTSKVQTESPVKSVSLLLAENE